jgi:replicative DNA helicase
LGGFQKSDLIILAARPSMGKTALGMAFAKNAAVLSKVPVAVFSLEMATIQLVIRLISSEGKIDAHKLRTGRMPKEEGSKLWRVASKLIEAPVFIDDAPAQTILEIRAKARRLKSEKKIGLIIIDYLQLIQGSSRTESREREISTISRSLKALAKELEIPVIALAQLNRAVFINSPEYYGMKTYADGNSTEGLAEVIIAKQRNGPTGEVKLTFVKEFARFESREHFRRTEDVSVSQIEHEDVI